MINDPTIRGDIVQQWAAVRSLCRGSHRQAIVAPGVFINGTPLEEIYNLPFVLAYAVLDQVFDALMDQGTFPSPGGRPMLGAKMNASRAHLPWVDYAAVETGRVARNEVAHDAKPHGKTDCLRFVDNIERELKAWGIV